MAIRTANNQSLTEITAFPSAVALGGMVLLATETASSDGTIEFTSNIDSTYSEYVFKFINIHPSSNGARFNFNLSIDAGSNYNVTKTTTYFTASLAEDDTGGALGYNTGADLAQGTGDQNLFRGVGAANDECINGTLHLYNPSSTTFVKHFLVRTSTTTSDPSEFDTFVAGYGNTTSAVDAVKFLFHTGNVDSGTFKMYGVT